MNRRPSRALSIAQTLEVGASSTRPWGYIVAPGLMSREARLIVLSPASPVQDRRLWWLSIVWDRYLAVIVGVLTVVMMIFTWASAYAIVLAGGIWIVGRIALHVFGRRRGHCPREARVTVMSSRRRPSGVELSGDVISFLRLQQRLEALDRLHLAGRLTPAQYENEWGAIYRSLRLPVFRAPSSNGAQR